jgi:hypothetical protein
MLFIDHIDFFDPEYYISNGVNEACEKYQPASSKAALGLIVRLLTEEVLESCDGRHGKPQQPFKIIKSDVESIELKHGNVLFRFACRFKGTTSRFALETDDFDLATQIVYLIHDNPSFKSFCGNDGDRWIFQAE